MTQQENSKTVSEDVAAFVKQAGIYRQALIDARGTFTERLAASERFAGSPPVPEIPREAYQLPPIFYTSLVTSDTYRLIQRGRFLPSQAVTEDHVAQAREYVSNLLTVDLSNVRVELIPVDSWDSPSSEGMNIAMGFDNHLIFMPDHFSSPVEVLVHEFGHAAHATAARKNGVLASFYILPTTAEFVAHFCQFNYLLEHGSRAYFDAALHQITEAAYALSIISTGITENFSEFMTTEASRAIAAVMSTHLLRERYENFRRDKAWLQNQAMRGIALILTLALIDEKEGMIRFIHADRVDRSLEQKLTAAFLDVGVMEKVALINEQISSLQGRFDR